jgi:hypothetical protein
MGAAVEAHADLAFGYGDIGGHVDEIAEDLARLSVILATGFTARHTTAGRSLQVSGDDTSARGSLRQDHGPGWWRYLRRLQEKLRRIRCPKTKDV